MFLFFCYIKQKVKICYNMNFFVIKKRHLCLILCAILLLVGLGTYFGLTAQAYQPNLSPTVVIDAGHGGRDGGAVGRKTGVTESQINLQYAQTLKEILQSFGVNVVMTRTDLNGLYSPFAANKKKDDMQKRKQIIDESGADLVVSVHMNAFPRSSTRGAQAFYAMGNSSGAELAQSVQKQLQNVSQHAHSVAKQGDYYILNCTSLPGVLVEFGFLSNAEEESLLVESAYRQSMCEAVAMGILNFYQM